MRRLESSSEEAFVRWLKRNKIKWEKKATGALLDRKIYLPRGHLFIIEFKRKDSGRLKRTQVKEIRELRALGYDVEVHDEVKEAIKAVQERLNGTAKTPSRRSYKRFIKSTKRKLHC